MRFAEWQDATLSHFEGVRVTGHFHCIRLKLPNNGMATAIGTTTNGLRTTSTAATGAALAARARASARARAKASDGSQAKARQVADQSFLGRPRVGLAKARTRARTRAKARAKADITHPAL